MGIFRKVADLNTVKLRRRSLKFLLPYVCLNIKNLSEMQQGSCLGGEKTSLF